MFDQLPKPFNRIAPYIVGIICSCMIMILIAACIAIVDTSIVKLWSWRTTVRTSLIVYDTYLQRKDCILVSRISDLNVATFECGNETIHIWIP